SLRRSRARDLLGQPRRMAAGAGPQAAVSPAAESARLAGRAPFGIGAETAAALPTGRDRPRPARSIVPRGPPSDRPPIAARARPEDRRRASVGRNGAAK